jgi:hypothetical protein
MGNAVYPKWKEAVIQASSNSSLAGNVKVVAVDLADYTYSAAHDFLDDVPSGARIATSANLGSKTFVNGVFDAADTSFTTPSGDPFEAYIIYIDTGVEATSRLVAFLDTVTGLPVTPDGVSDIDLRWPAGGIFQL